MNALEKERKQKMEVLKSKYENLKEAGIEEINAVLELAMERRFELTGNLIVRHIPERELKQAAKEFNKAKHPVRVIDLCSLAGKTGILGKTVSEVTEFIGVTRNRYYELTTDKDPNEPLQDTSIALTVKLLRKLPSVVPPGPPDPLTVHSSIGGADKINFQIFPILLGLDASRSRGWKGSVSPSEVVRPMLKILEEYPHQAERILDILIDNVYEEGRARGKTPFKDMTWKGIPQEGHVEDIDRKYLNLPTVDHRRVEARAGKIVGWPATDERLKKNVELIKKSNRKKAV